MHLFQYPLKYREQTSGCTVAPTFESKGEVLEQIIVEKGAAK
jgi:hypothetical protein